MILFYLNLPYSMNNKMRTSLFSYFKSRMLNTHLRNLHDANVLNHQNMAIFAYDRISLEIQLFGLYEKDLLNGLAHTVFKKIDLVLNCTCG